MGLRKLIDKIKPDFERGARFGRFSSTFDAFETFLYVPNKVSVGGAHIRDAIDMKRTMFFVVIALIPCFLFGTWNVGYQHFAALAESASFWRIFGYGLMKVIPLYLVSYIVGLVIEFTFAEIRGHEVNEGYFVTGFIIPLLLPPDMPLWTVALATAFAVIIGKEVFGGTGMNIVNPALLARAFLFFSYPSKMSGDKVWVSGVDTLTGATPMSGLFSGSTDVMSMPYTASDLFLGVVPGCIGETSKLAILIGGFFLLVTGVASWRIVLSVFAGGLGFGLLFNAIGGTPAMEVPFYYHFLLGGFMFGALFMATDPVTAAQTDIGKVIYGFLIGALTVTIRVFNTAYPEGMMLSILLMNIFAPLIDHCVVAVNIRKRKKRASKR